MKLSKAIIYGIAIIVAAAILGNAYISRTQKKGTISVTGLGKKDFTSDLIVWDAYFNTTHPELKQAYARMEKDKDVIMAYLKEKGIPESAIVFSAVSANKETRTLYSDEGKYMGEEFIGHALSRSVQVSSDDVNKVETISREITELLNLGVQLYSGAPRYYYTGLADLKIEMISAATEDARIRAEKIAEHAGDDLGDLVDARMGVFQITGQHSDEDYSWGGTFNTEDKEKTASITMKLMYEVD